MIRILRALGLFCLFLSGGVQASDPNEKLISIPGGIYVPFVLRSNVKKGDKEQFQKTPVSLVSFSIDRDLVTNEDFLQFVRTNPEWRRSKVKLLFADSHYLEAWTDDLNFPSMKDRKRPVTSVSWFAARAYCESLGKDLPTTDQWEFVYFDLGRKQRQVKEKALAWYGTPTPHKHPQVRSGGKNGLGVYDLSSVVWEWTLDFNSFLAGDELRGSSEKDSGLFCGGGSMGTLDSSDYAAFMRYSFRASLKAAYTTRNLGFRCAKGESE